MKYLLLFSLFTSLFASYDVRNGQDIQKHFATSFSAKLQTNELKRQYTSIDSLIQDMQEYGIKDIKVVDFKTLQFIDAKKAFFIYKSNIKPTYGKYSIVAFKNKANALLHVKNYKGKILDFKTLIKTATNNLETNYNFMQKRYKKRAFVMGKKVYEKFFTQELDMSEFLEISELKNFLHVKTASLNLDDVHFEALSLYLWFVKRTGDLGITQGGIEVSEDEKCPVCGMFVYKYPKWAAQIFYEHEKHIHHLFFDGVKDMMKFYFNPQKWGNYAHVNKDTITKMLVSDYYTNKAIEAKEAYYVIRSDIYGPMGHELIPFSTYEEALAFKHEHRGKKVLTFDEIKEDLPYKLDINEF